MSGIIGYIGNKRVVPLLLDGLERLQYRGYDSAGLAVVQDGKLEVRRAPGKLRNLREAIRLNPLDGAYGIGHTRWATHGPPNEENAHPHRDCHNSVAVVHNGIIDNDRELRQELEAEGHQFATETDTEVIAHLIEDCLNAGGESGRPVSLDEAVRAAVQRLSGVFALAIISTRTPDEVVVVRQGPPAVIGLGRDEYLVASDVPAILYHTRDLFFLADGNLAVLTPHGVKLMDFDGRPVTRRVQHISWEPVLAEKGGFRHFMHKEIYDQPRAVRDTTLGRISPDTGQVFLDEMEIAEDEFRAFSGITLVAAGSSRNAGLCGKFMLERLARVRADVDYASEFRYRDPLVDPSTLTVLVTQSGETADTIAGQREARAKGSKTLAICNSLGSMVSREAKGVIYTHAGPEIGVSATKTFTAELVALYLFSIYLGQIRKELTAEDARRLLADLVALPRQIESVLQHDEEIEDLAREFHRATDFLFLGRGVHFPIALESALKTKKVSYIHAAGYPAGEMKHGPAALITDGLPVVVLATVDDGSADSQLRYRRTLLNIKEAKARGANIIVLVTEGDTDATELADHAIVLPPANELLSPVLEIVPLQLLAYHLGVLRGCDVDQPRNLAKSVTVE
ncbi:MAG TPA: glutamine--fructose-6-phosphate transaminase (isomerizing) [Terriglobia bacterium]|nr:glutamine--fructose-6-phosphate transaminase (isomerizing) [Terriglobia bacterium]